jgi:hypothetical protein
MANSNSMAKFCTVTGTGAALTTEGVAPVPIRRGRPASPERIEARVMSILPKQTELAVGSLPLRRTHGAIGHAFIWRFSSSQMRTTCDMRMNLTSV